MVGIIKSTEGCVCVCMCVSFRYVCVLATIFALHQARCLCSGSRVNSALSICALRPCLPLSSWKYISAHEYANSPWPVAMAVPVPVPALLCCDSLLGASVGAPALIHRKQTHRGTETRGCEAQAARVHSGPSGSQLAPCGSELNMGHIWLQGGGKIIWLSITYWFKDEKWRTI